VGVVKTGRKRMHLPVNQVTTLMVCVHVGSPYQGQEEVSPLQDLE